MSSIGEQRGKSRTGFVPVKGLGPLEPDPAEAARRRRMALMQLVCLPLLLTPLWLRPHPHRAAFPDWPWRTLPAVAAAVCAAALALIAIVGWRNAMRVHRSHLAGDDGHPR